MEDMFFKLLNLYKNRHQMPYLVAVDFVIYKIYTCINF